MRPLDAATDRQATRSKNHRGAASAASLFSLLAATRPSVLPKRGRRSEGFASRALASLAQPSFTPRQNAECRTDFPLVGQVWPGAGSCAQERRRTQSAGILPSADARRTHDNRLDGAPPLHRSIVSPCQNTGERLSLCRPGLEFRPSPRYCVRGVPDVVLPECSASRSSRDFPACTSVAQIVT
jgi:hypothetical protein